MHSSHTIRSSGGAGAAGSNKLRVLQDLATSYRYGYVFVTIREGGGGVLGTKFI